jgi:hypothetical protein
MPAVVPPAHLTSVRRLLPQFVGLMHDRHAVLVVRLLATEVAFVLIEAARDGVSVEAMLRTLGKEGLYDQQEPLYRDSGVRRLRVPIDAVSDASSFVTWLVQRAIRRRREQDALSGVNGPLAAVPAGGRRPARWAIATARQRGPAASHAPRPHRRGRR